MSTHTEQITPVQSPEFQTYAQRIAEVLDATSRLNVLPFGDVLHRTELLEVVFGRRLPDSVTIYPPFFTEHGLGTTFGQDVFVNQGCTFMDLGGIAIGDRVMIGPKVNLVTSGHPVALSERREHVVSEPIVIEDDVWIGAAATITQGVRIGAGSVIAAGAVITRDVAAGTVVGGVPGRVITSIY